MSEDHGVEIKQDALNVVDSWLGASSSNQEEEAVKQPVFERRAQRLGLGAKYVPHKKKTEPPSVLKKKLLREKRRKREQRLEEAGDSSNSDSKEEGLSKAKLVKSKLNHEFAKSVRPDSKKRKEK
ncbi:uncharacterized protein [Blastocystis hominis]|uniref:Uncharacterized protein n=1 Tax=Blastocystis hominis TaxID=12968 RepID=D8M917_BLAHO|nr:uncharacterized protein [Blastocystis hominis]CBK24556.2 unnamed protein product [Blastocystis hominis]|eukprot:XP_012898604.1 uncharacterized protein [Blastocystis hominis]